MFSPPGEPLATAPDWVRRRSSAHAKPFGTPETLCAPLRRMWWRSHVPKIFPHTVTPFRRDSKGSRMFCPFCRHTDSRVVDSRTSDDGLSIRRRRECPSCGGRFSTLETASLSVIKRNGVVEPFSREKIVAGVRKACQGRPVTDAELAALAQRVEETVRATGVSQIDANEIGLAILPELRTIDLVAYLRFASVYKAFESLADFDRAIEELRNDGGSTKQS